MKPVVIIDTKTGDWARYDAPVPSQPPKRTLCGYYSNWEDYLGGKRGISILDIEAIRTCDYDEPDDGAPAA